MIDCDIEIVFHFYVCVFQIFLFFLKKRQRFMAIYDKKSYLNNTILLKGHLHNLERFANKYKESKHRIVLNRSNHTAMTLRDTSNYKSSCIKMNNPFDDIKELNTKNQTVHVGAMITMGKLMNYLYPLGYALQIVPEFKSLTVGGLIVGGGLESSSVHYGLFPLQCIEYTIVLGNGEIKKVTEDEEPELFSSIPLSYGTLGTIVDVRMNIIPIKPNIHLECVVITDYELIQSSLQNILKDTSSYEFIEGIIYSKSKTIIIKGNFIDNLIYPVIHPVTWYDPYFYQMIETYVDQGKMYCSMNLLDYYFRHDRGSFWVLKHVMGDNKISRAINPFVNHASDKNLVMQPIMKGILNCMNIEIQDSVVPLSNVQNILTFADKNYSIYPIWLCPCRNVDATLKQKKIIYKILKTLPKGLFNESIDIDKIIYLSEHIDINTIKHIDINTINKCINDNKHLLYKDKLINLVEKISNATNKEDIICLLLDAIKIKTSLLGLLQTESIEDFYIDIGIYGRSPRNRNKDDLLAIFEELTNKYQGLMGQYAVTTLSREQFENKVIKNKWYKYLRNKYNATKSFPDIYDKLGSTLEKK